MQDSLIQVNKGAFRPKSEKSKLPKIKLQTFAPFTIYNLNFKLVN